MNVNSVVIALGALLPSAGVAFLFYLIIKAMLEGDRRERLAHSKWEADEVILTTPAGQQRNVQERDSA